MEDPSSVLAKSLESVFRLEPIRNDKYTCNEVQLLKDAIQSYKDAIQSCDPKAKDNFLILLGAVKDAMPYIAKWKINFKTVRKSLDNMAKLHQTPTIDWSEFIAHPKVSYRFQYCALNNNQSEHDLNALIKVTELNNTQLTQAIVDNREKQGFSSKLLGYLKIQPDFLFNLILKSKRSFIKIVKTRLILYLTDEQLAHAIIKHLPEFLNNKKEPFKDPFDEVEQLIDTLNEILSKGRSISTLLRNADAKLILDNSVIFQIYQSEEYLHRYDHDGSDNHLNF